jgi:DNA/RNA endonuclease YhcR with UshA esterase domain
MNRIQLSGILHAPAKVTTTHQNKSVALGVFSFDEKHDGRITIFASGKAAIELEQVAVGLQVTVEGRLVQISGKLEMSVDRIKGRRRNENEEIVEEAHSHSLHSGFSRTRPPSR